MHLPSMCEWIIEIIDHYSQSNKYLYNEKLFKDEVTHRWQPDSNWTYTV